MRSQRYLMISSLARLWLNPEVSSLSSATQTTCDWTVYVNIGL